MKPGDLSKRVSAGLLEVYIDDEASLDLRIEITRLCCSDARCGELRIIPPSPADELLRVRWL